jgi:predicted nucleic acid-binding protein
MRIYLDANIFGRPFDDRSQLRIALESEACLLVLELAKQKKVDCLGSDILSLEISRGPIPKRFRVQSLLELCSKHISETNELKHLAQQLSEESGIQGRDALHIASACIGKAEYFITCDDTLIRKHKKIERIVKRLGYNIKIIGALYFVAEVKL